MSAAQLTLFEPPAARSEAGALVNCEAWERAVSQYVVRKLARRIARIRRRVGVEGLTPLMPALTLAASITDVARHFPDLAHVATPEAVYCMAYRREVADAGCECENFAHGCDRFRAHNALIWAYQLAGCVLRGNTPEQMTRVRRFLTRFYGVRELNEPEPDEWEGFDLIIEEEG
jgi:hypothetical protein